MTIAPHIIPSDWIGLFNALAFVALATGLFFFPSKAITSVVERQHLLWGSAVALAVLWSVGTSLQGEGIRIHMLGITAVVMLLGFSPALITGAVAMILYSVVGLSEWSMLSVNYITLIVIPAVVTQGWLMLITRLPFNNLFLYMLGGGFIGGVISRLTLAGILGMMGLLAGDGSAMAITSEKYLPWLLLLAFPEGFINGMLISALAVFFPHWLRSLDEYRYIDKRE